MATSKTSLLPLLIILTALSTALNVGLFRRVSEVSHKLWGPQRHNFEHPYEPGEVPGYFQPAAMTLEAPDTQYPLDDDHKWASIVPNKRGFIRHGAKGVPISISLYHQLHCVNGIRFAYVATRDGLFKTEKARAASFAHVNHCFDLLRQSMLCKSDTTLIPVNASSQAGVTRRCRDWEQVRKFVDENHEFWRDIPYDFHPTANDRSKGYAHE
ncbi:hypothetical protein DFH08DRAFT_73561 [Mycena albidolilacea]|uniref:Oxidase ustYa n=1 Tax=Mycena albidolilacea TaxID=1033008 RepID=A0AAD6Z086_9AGAR|nr:hypothetical protein DFH08DRAFT_73561 [Mycena albidolilacea]